MSKECKKIRQDLDPFVDQELENRRKAEIESHFEHCKPCLRIYQLIAGLKDRIHRTAPPGEPPAHLRGKILQALDQESARSMERVSHWWSWERRAAWRPAPALVLVTLVLVIVVVTRSTYTEAHNFTEITLSALHRMQNGDLMPVTPESDMYRIKFASTKLPNGPVPSLAGMDYSTEGCCFGLSIENTVAHYVFKNSSGSKVSLVMWKGLSPEDKIEGEQRTFMDKDFFVATREGVNLVLWKDKDVFCSVFGDPPLEDLLKAAACLRGCPCK